MRLNSLEELYLLMLVQYQCFGMAHQDAQKYVKGEKLVYALDTIDLSTYLLPTQFHSSEKIPQPESIIAKWHQFFNHPLGENVITTISPLTLIEFFRLLRYWATDPSHYRRLKKQYGGIDNLVAAFESMGIEKRGTSREALILSKTYRHMMTSKSLNLILCGEIDNSPFDQIKSLIDNRKMTLWKDILASIDAQKLSSELFEHNRQLITTGINYLLERKRTKDSSLIDVYNYVLHDNLNKLRSDRGIRFYITSSGYLSRNAWVITEFGRLLENLDDIPDSWSARTSDAPFCLIKAYEHVKGDAKSLIQFLEEGKSLSRVILRDLFSIDQVYHCIHDPKQRAKLHKENPEIPLANSLGQTLQRFQRQYYRFIVPETIGSLTTIADIPYSDIDTNMLLKWMKDPKKRGEFYQDTVNKLREEVRELQLFSADWIHYAAPIGKNAYDIIELLMR
jgi:hypothetical protein